jgi:hypothetical protein
MRAWALACSCAGNAMTESAFTREVLKRLRLRFARQPLIPWFVWKVNDRITGGIPDVVVVRHATTFFFEFKKARRAGQDPRTLVTTLQNDTLKRISAANGNQVYVVVRHPDDLFTVYAVTSNGSYCVMASGLDYTALVDAIDTLTRTCLACPDRKAA